MPYSPHAECDCCTVDNLGKMRAGGVGGVNPGHMMVKLLISILMPLFVGKVSR